MPAVSTLTIEPVVGGMSTYLDGCVLTSAENLTSKNEYTVPMSLHVQGAVVHFQNIQVGDLAWASVVHPASKCSLAAEATSGQNQLDLGPYAAYYNPAGGALFVEIWNSAEDQIQEVVGITSISGNVLTLSRNLNATYSTSYKAVAVYKTFSPVRGTNGTDGGMRFHGDGAFYFKHENVITDLIPAGLVIVTKLKTCSTTGTRTISINYIMRESVS